MKEKENISKIHIEQNQSKNIENLTKRIYFSKEHYKKLEIMLPYYSNDENKIDTMSKVIGMAIDCYFNKFVENLQKLSENEK